MKLLQASFPVIMSALLGGGSYLEGWRLEKIQFWALGLCLECCAQEVIRHESYFWHSDNRPFSIQRYWWDLPAHGVLTIQKI